MKYATKFIPVLLILQPLFAFAAGIQVSPARLDFTVAANRQTSQTLTVVNPTADVQLFEVYADNFTESVKTSPASFTLEAGAKKTVTVTVNFDSQNSNRILSTTLSVVGKPLLGSQQFSVGTGVKIPLSITQTAQTEPAKIPKAEMELTLAMLLIIVGLWSVYVHKTSNT